MAWRRGWEEAGRLNERGRGLEDAGDLDGALAAYVAAFTADPRHGASLFNAGRIYKWRCQWHEAVACNVRAAEIDGGEQEPAWWNLGIAATGLRDWELARRAWRSYGVDIPDGTGPIDGNFGNTPVRLNPDTSGEVVWGRRLDPARVRILNIPFAESGHRFGDIVLHDGAPNGERMSNGQARPVFDELERWEASSIPTFQVRARVASEDDVDRLAFLTDAGGWGGEDWTTVRLICKSCSEGAASDQHEHRPEPDGDWQIDRNLAIAAPAFHVHALLETWVREAPNRREHDVPVEVA